MNIRLLPLLFLLLSGLPLLLAAQPPFVSVSGVIRNRNGQALEAATVFLKRQKDSSIARTAVTNRSGEYAFSRLTPGRYFLSVSSIGYAPYSGGVVTPDSTAVVQDILLAPAQKELKAVSVVTQKRFVEWKLDKLVVNVAASPFYDPGQSALDVLERSPGVVIDYFSNTISLNNRQGPTIYINGRLSYLSGQDLINYLRGLPAGTLEQIELITQPSAKYDAAGSGGVINIILKKNRADGLFGSFTASAIVGYYFKTRDNLVLDWRSGKMNLDLTYGIADDPGFNDQHILSSFRPGYGLPFSQYQDYSTSTVSTSVAHTPRLSVDYQASANTSLGLNLNGLFSSASNNTNGPINLYDSLYRLTQRETFINSVSTPVANFGANLNLQQKLDKKGTELSADADYHYYHSPGTQNSYNYPYDANGLPLGPELLDGRLPAQIDIYAFKTDYSHPFRLKRQRDSAGSADAKVEAGIKSSYVRTDNDEQYTLYDTLQKKWQADTALTNHFIYTEQINAAYVSVSEQLNKKWSLEMGLRAEQTLARGDQTVQNSRFSRNYFQLFPTVYIGYTPNEVHSFELSYGHRMDRPGYVDLNPFRYIINQYNIREGNPNLQPEYVNSIDISYHHKSDLLIWLDYIKLDNLFTRAFVNGGPGNELLTIQTKENIQSRRNIFLSIYYNKALTHWWNASWSLSYVNARLADPADAGNTVDQITAVRLYFTNQFPLGKGWALDLRGNYNTRRLEGIHIYALPSGSASVGFSKKLLQNKGSFTATLNDPFLFYKPGQTSEAAGFFMKTTNHPESRILTLTFNYRFGKAKQQQRRQSDGSAQDEQRRVNF
jgi:hypothetical protein